MKIAIPLFDRLTALDAVGPYEVLSRLPGAEVRFVGRERGVVRTDTGMLALTVDRTFEELPAPEVIVVPGGVGARIATGDEPTLDWIRGAHAGSRYTTSVCTGSLLLAAAGVLDGVEATTHWLFLDRLERPVRERVVDRGRVITAAGVSAGIDMALLLAARLAGPEVAQAIQLGIEYDPQPPFNAGSPDTAPAAIVEAARAAQAREDALAA